MANPRKKAHVKQSKTITLFVPTGKLDDEEEEIREEKTFSVKWNRRALYRMSKAGFERQVDGSDFAFVTNVIAATLQGKHALTAEDVADALPEDEKKAKVVIDTVMSLLPAPGKEKKK